MKKNLSPILILTILNLLFYACEKKGTKNEINERGFLNPPSSTQMHTWWHWMDGNITKEGITKDLEALKTAGISQATILNIGLFHERDLGNDRILFDTPEWYEHFKFALQEAARLGINIGFHNCDGWSSSGGPWVKPENAMKQMIWNTTLVNGGNNINLQLPELFSIQNYAKDVSVVAIKTEDEGAGIERPKPEITFNDSLKVQQLIDGCPASGIGFVKGNELVFKYDRATKIQKIAIHPRKEFTWSDLSDIFATFSLHSSNDGKNWTKAADIKIRGINKTIQSMVPDITAPYFKIRMEELSHYNSWLPYYLGELELLERTVNPLYLPEIKHHTAKIASSYGMNPKHYDFGKKADRIIKKDDIIDITDKVNDKGILNWDAPEGSWKIIRFGYTITGAKNGPATAEGEGLEVDKMDTACLNLHYKAFPAKLAASAGEFRGNTFKFLLIDSWECNFQNWTALMPESFEQINGYNMKDWMPVLCGEVVESITQSESFLYDFRATISHLIENNYYKHFSELCHADDLEMHAEVIYGGGTYPPLDILKATSYVDLPMFEFWSGHNDDAFIEFNPSDEPFMEFPMNAAVFYDKACGAEAYTGYAHYSESPGELKIYGDRAFCSGINQMILHSYVHQPTEQKPGYTLHRWGQAFNRHNTYWPHITEWMSYQSRMQYVLQNSKQVSDILFFSGDQLPQYLGEVKPKLPKGYSMNMCNTDILSKMQVIDGKLVSDNGLEFSMLVLPDIKGMHYSTLELIDKLVSQGVKLYGNQPEYSLSLTDNEEYGEYFTPLAERIWNSGGDVYSEISLEEAIKKAGILPDFAYSAKDSTKFLFIHKKLDNKDIYYVVNQLSTPVDAVCNFKVTGKFPEKWEQKNGQVYSIQDFTDNGTETEIHYQFKPMEATLFVFNGEQRSLPNYNMKAAKENVLSNLSGTIDFEPAYEGESKSVTFSNLNSLTEIEGEDFQHFTGQAKYTIKFKKPEGLSDGNKLFLRLGEIQSAGTASLNGTELGNAWSPNQEFDVSELIQEDNTLEVIVGIPYRNRFIGDLKEFGEQKTIFTTAYIENILSKDAPLKEVGLLGPIKIVQY